MHSKWRVGHFWQEENLLFGRIYLGRDGRAVRCLGSFDCHICLRAHFGLVNFGGCFGVIPLYSGSSFGVFSLNICLRFLRRERILVLRFCGNLVDLLEFS